MVLQAQFGFGQLFHRLLVGDGADPAADGDWEFKSLYPISPFCLPGKLQVFFHVGDIQKRLVRGFFLAVFFVKHLYPQPVFLHLKGAGDQGADHVWIGTDRLIISCYGNGLLLRFPLFQQRRLSDPPKHRRTVDPLQLPGGGRFVHQQAGKLLGNQLFRVLVIK
ncbi:hypothetical protein [Marinithermofilum abyssi]|uniref:hypothetical protein n=1 Tax=Marinithermofilum abyssi TaxID=1571185 RepID=UPI0016699346|nr:hypothetical protein [Marinithermofilum abyssi]